MFPVQLKQYQNRYTELELDLSTKHMCAEQEHLQLNSDLRRAQLELQRFKTEEVERVEREGREEVRRVTEEMRKELEEVKREREETVRGVRREGEEELVRVRKAGEEREKAHYRELREAIERTEMEKQK